MMTTLAIAAAMLASPGTAPVAASTPDLTGRFDGTYTYGGVTAVQTVQLEVERQHGRRLRASVFAMNQPEYMGRGHISRDGTMVTLATHATGRRRLVMMADVGDGGSSLVGTFTLKQRGHAAVTGTFSVGR
jgi:hypothetical protein